MRPNREGQSVTGARAIVWSLEALGITDVFGIPGGNVIPLYDALMDSDAIRHILTRHEQGAGHAAEGYAAASGRVGVAIATSGPGATNLVTAIADAHWNSLPVLIVTGQVSSKLIGTDAFQEADIVGITTPITKHSLLVTSAAEIPAALADAYQIASTGRPGPVLVDITKDAQQASAPFRWPTRSNLPGYNPPSVSNKRQIKAAAQLIRMAERPVLYIGAGVIRAEAARDLCELVDMTEIPVVTKLRARGVFPDSDERHLGISGMDGAGHAKLALHESDLIIAIGASFDDTPAGDPALFAPKAKVIHADIDPTEISKIRPAELPLVGDAKHVIRSLTTALASTGSDTGLNRSPWRKRPTDPPGGIPLEHETTKDGLLSPQHVIQRIGALTGPDAVFVSDDGQHQRWATRFIQCNRPTSWLNSSTPGYIVPAAMGAKVAQPERVVWAMDSDSCFQMANQELATCAVNRIPIKVAILNTANTVRPVPDFVKLAEAYGALAIRVTTPEETDAAINLALSTNDRTVVLDFVVSPAAMALSMTLPVLPVRDSEESRA